MCIRLSSIGCSNLHNVTKSKLYLVTWVFKSNTNNSLKSGSGTALVGALQNL